MVVTWPSVNRGKPTLRISSCISGMRVESLPTPENLICATAYVSGGRSRINRFGYRSTLKLYTKLYMKVNRGIDTNVRGDGFLPMARLHTHRRMLPDAYVGPRRAG